MRKEALIGVMIAAAVLALTSFAAYTARQQTVCTARGSTHWQAVPEIIDTGKLARALDIRETRVSDGRLGWVVCQEPVSVIDMRAGRPPVVKVPGHGSHCAAINAGRVNGVYPPMSRKVLVLCAAAKRDPAGA